MYRTVTQLVTDSGLHLMSVCEAKLEEEGPRTLLKDTGFEDQCAKLNNHPAKYNISPIGRLGWLRGKLV